MTPRLRTAAAAVLSAALLPLAAGCGWFGDEEQTRLTLTVSTPDGGPPTEATLTATAGILTDRFTAADLPEPTIEADGSRLVVTIEGQVEADQVEWLLVPGELQFRKVLASVEDPGEPAPERGSGRVPTWQVVSAQVGDAAVTAAEDWLDSLPGPVPVLAGEPDPATAPFRELTGLEVAAVPARFQFYLPAIGCAQLADRPLGATRAPEQLAVACDETTKYLLDQARLAQPDLAGATSEPSPQLDGWHTLLGFTPDGQQRWTELTQEASRNDAGAPLDPAALTDENSYAADRPIQCAPNGAPCQVAMVLDHQVISAPQVVDVITGDAQITGFDQAEATYLASVLQFQPLPVRLSLESTEVG